MNSLSSLALLTLALLPAPRPQAPKTLVIAAGGADARRPISQRDMPLTIAAPGSYYLTEALQGVAGASGITIASDDVTLDLNGFALVGVPGSLDGIQVTEPGPHANLSILNGTVRGWGGDGIDTSVANSSSASGLIREIRASNNGGDGIKAGREYVVEGCVALENAGIAIRGTLNCHVKDCTTGMGQHGIQVLRGRVTDCVVRGTQGRGIQGLGDDTIEGCDVSGSAIGIEALRGNVSGCSSSFNTAYGFVLTQGSALNCTANSNNGHGFYATQSALQNSSANNNGGAGFSAQGGSLGQCTAYANAQDGIAATDGTLQGCSANANGGNGIGLTRGSISSCHAADNDQVGLSCVEGSITASSATRNGADGIAASFTLVLDCTSAFNQGNGAEIVNSQVRHCSLYRNVGAEILVGSGNSHSTYPDNHMID